jgi:BirA family biotin operon repressor/biotin-[acetyl-CoA-carboxylase] ligase
MITPSAAQNTLAAGPTPWLANLNASAEHLWPTFHDTYQRHALSRSLPGCEPQGFTIEVVPTIDSTNSELMRRARAGQTEPVLLIAAEQTAGRGRMGKVWQSQVGDSLTFSLGLPLAPASWAGLSLAVGVSVADSLAKQLAAHPAANTTTHPVQLKWPNDVWLGGAKLAGILVETAHTGGNRCVVVGVGINLQPPTLSQLPSDTASAGQWPGVLPTGLRQHAPDLDATQVLHAVATALLNDVLAFETLGFEAFAQRFAQRDALRDQALVLSDGTQGTGCGVDDDGALLVLTASGMKTVNSAEVSVRPRDQAPC